MAGIEDMPPVGRDMLFRVIRNLGFQRASAAPPKLCYGWPKAGGKMSTDAIEILITKAIHTAFIKYPEGDGGPNMDYEWIPADQSAHIAKAILLDLEASGYHITKKA